MVQFDYPRMVIEFSEHQKIFLSKREVECLCLQIQGLSIEQIASRLKLNEKTVEFYSRNICKKIYAYDIFKPVQQSDNNQQ